MLSSLPNKIIQALVISALFTACTEKKIAQNTWITPLETKLDLHSLQGQNYETLCLQDNQQGLKAFYTLENTQRGDERSNWQTILTYTPEGLLDFHGELTLNYWEVPFHNQNALSLKLSANLWDQQNKRSRDYLPFGSCDGQLIYCAEPDKLLQTIEPSRNNSESTVYCFPMVWSHDPETLAYQALLNRVEVNKLIKEIKTNPQGRFYFSSAGRKYELKDLGQYLEANLQEIATNLNLRLRPNESNLVQISQTIGSKKLFTSPWLSLGKQYMKIQMQYSSLINSPVRLTLVIASYDATNLRNAYMGNASLIFNEQDEVYFVPLEKLTYFSSLQHKQTSLLSFATIPTQEADFFEQRTWKNIPKEFWQFNLISQNLSEEDFNTIVEILNKPASKLSLVLSEDLLFNNEIALKYLENLLKLLFRFKKNGQA